MDARGGATPPTQPFNAVTAPSFDAVREPLYEVQAETEKAKAAVNGHGTSYRYTEKSSGHLLLNNRYASLIFSFPRHPEVGKA